MFCFSGGPGPQIGRGGALTERSILFAPAMATPTKDTRESLPTPSALPPTRLAHGVSQKHSQDCQGGAKELRILPGYRNPYGVLLELVGHAEERPIVWWLFPWCRAGVSVASTRTLLAHGDHTHAAPVRAVACLRSGRRSRRCCLSCALQHCDACRNVHP